MKAKHVVRAIIWSIVALLVTAGVLFSWCTSCQLQGSFGRDEDDPAQDWRTVPTPGTPR